MRGRMHARFTATATAVAVAVATTVAVATDTIVAGATTAPQPAPRGAGHHLLAPSAPAPGFPESLGLTHRDVIDIGAGLLIALMLVVILVLRVRRRRRAAFGRSAEPFHHAFPLTAESWRGSGLAEESMVPLPPFQASSLVLPALAVSPGWHPVQGDSTKLAYWDGASWSAFRQWDGHQWVDPTSLYS